jgi:hypothetical protein
MSMVVRSPDAKKGVTLRHLSGLQVMFLPKSSPRPSRPSRERAYDAPSLGVSSPSSSVSSPPSSKTPERIR